jgi:polysaccharide biosynthesis transport protein
MNTRMTEANVPGEPTVGLRQYLEVVWRRKLTVMAILVLALGAAVAFTLAQNPQYKAETTIIVGQAGGLVQPQNAGAIQPFSATMQELIRSTVVAQRVIRALKLAETPEALLSEISVGFNPESAALNVSVVDRSPQRAQAIAAQIGVSFSALVRERFGQPGSATVAPLTATVWDPAHVIPGKIRPTPKLNLIVAGILGVVFGLLAALVLDYFDRRLRTVEEIERALGVPVIGQIPSLKRNDQDRPRMLWNENGNFAEAFRALRANLQYLAVGRPLRTILITSPSPGEGKTTVSANLATALAESGASVAVVEADLRRPKLGAAFRIPPNGSGLTTILVGQAKLSEAVSAVELPESARGLRSDGRRMAVLLSGPLPPNPSELVGSPKMDEVMRELSEAFEHVIVDSPPMLIVADSLELAKHVDGVIVVVRLKHATSDDASELRALAARLGIHLVGVVVTDVPQRAGYGYAAYAAEPDRDTPADPAGVSSTVPVSRARGRTREHPPRRSRARTQEK